MNEDETISTGVKIVRPSSRRKFLVDLLGGGAILAAGTPDLQPLIQNIRVAWNTKPYPYNLFNDNDGLVGDSYSPDLNFMAMTKVEDDGYLSIWDYQRQCMTTLPTGSESGSSSWGPDNRRLLFQSQTSLDLWDVPTRQQLASYDGDAYQGFTDLFWSPDGTRVVQFASSNDNGSGNVLVIMSIDPLKPLSQLKAPDSAPLFCWSPDSRKLAFLQGSPDSALWHILIWEIQRQQVVAEIPVKRQSQPYPSDLAWSPDGVRIAVLYDGGLHIIEMGKGTNTYTLDEPNQGGKLVWSPDSRYLAVAIALPSNGSLTSCGKFGVWDVIERKYVRLLRYSTFFEIPDALSWSQDGTNIRAIADVYQQENWSWP